MSTNKKSTKLEKSWVILKVATKIGDKQYKKGDKVKVTAKGRTYLESINKI